jgi:hypothetical protein
MRMSQFMAGLIIAINSSSRVVSVFLVKLSMVLIITARKNLLNVCVNVRMMRTAAILAMGILE